MTATAYLGIIIALQAWPVYAMLQARQSGAVPTAVMTWVIGGLAAAALVSAVAIVLPLRVAVRRIEAIDR
jgi:hypothetical protein